MKNVCQPSCHNHITCDVTELSDFLFVGRSLLFLKVTITISWQFMRNGEGRATTLVVVVCLSSTTHTVAGGCVSPRQDSVSKTSPFYGICLNILRRGISMNIWNILVATAWRHHASLCIYLRRGLMFSWNRWPPPTEIDSSQRHEFMSETYRTQITELGLFQFSRNSLNGAPENVLIEIIPNYKKK